MRRILVATVAVALAGTVGAYAQTTTTPGNTTAAPATPMTGAPATTPMGAPAGTPTAPGTTMGATPGTTMGTTTGTPRGAAGTMGAPGTATGTVTGTQRGAAAGTNPTSPSAVSTTGTSSNQATPAAGANSFTEGQAKARVSRAGYANVSALHKDEQGVWRGTATKGGKQMTVGVDFQGHVTGH